jgi:putative transposase
MGKRLRAWQDTEYILALFGRSVSEARRNLQRHVSKWAAKGPYPELTGGGLIRSAGGWRAVKEAYRDGIRLASDERVLGSSQFVEKTLEKTGEAYERRMRMQASGLDLSRVINAVCGFLKVEERDLAGPTRRLEIARARALVGLIATRDLSISGSEVARRLNVDRSAISRAVQRAGNDPELMAAADTILALLQTGTSQH